MPDPGATASVASGATGGAPADFDALFDRAFSVVAFVMNRHLIDHMLRSARRFGADFEMLVIWGVLGHQNVAHLMPPGTVPSAVLDESGRPTGRNALRPLKLRDVSQITGIPRETVRRKLERLRAAGWVAQVEDGWQIDVNSIDPELREFTRETARRFLAAAEEVTHAMRDAARAVERERALP